MRINEISDPYLRDRLVLPQPPRSRKKWLFGILIIITVLLVMGGYFFPQKFYAIQEFFGKETPSEEEPVLNPVIPESHKGATAISTISPPVSTEAVSPPENVAIPTVSKPSVPENNTDTAAVPTVQESPEILLERAKQQLKQQHFTSPAGNNAYETSQQLAKIAPPLAQEIVNTIVNWYLEQGQRYLLDKNRLQSAFEVYQRAQEIAPEHPQVKEGVDKIVRECRRLALGYRKSGKRTQGLKVVEEGLKLKPQDKDLLQLKEQLKASR